MKGNPGLKGISPLVAVIMLIAFTMVVAGILASWASQFALTQRAQIQTCSQASIFLQSGIYSSGAETLDIMVWNNGDVPLSGFTALITFINETVFSHSRNDMNISIGSIETLQITGMTSDIKQVVVRSNECRGAQDMLLKYNIKGLF